MSTPNQRQMWQCGMCHANNVATSRACTSCGYRSAANPLTSQGRAATFNVQEFPRMPEQLSQAVAHPDGNSALPNAFVGRKIFQSPSPDEPVGASGHSQMVPLSPHNQGHSADSLEQIEHLTSAVKQSHQYGRDIEAAIEHLADLLHKKTVECEGLRALANENYGPLRQAVRGEYESRIRAETRHEQELRQLYSQIEVLKDDKQNLQAEVAALKELVKELENEAQINKYSKYDGSLFNRVLRGAGVMSEPTGRHDMTEPVIGANQEENRRLELHGRIVLMYQKYAPHKLTGLNELLEKYPPEVLLSALISKHGPEPSPAEREYLLRSIVAD